MIINPEVFRHPEDKESYDKVSRNPLFKLIDFLYRKLIFTEEDIKVLLNTKYVRAGEKVYQDYYNVLTDICEKIEADVPELYVGQPQHVIQGIVAEKTYIVMSLTAEMSYPKETIPCLVARELGNVLSQDAKPRSILSSLSRKLERNQNFIIKILTIFLASQVEKNTAANELTSDRVALLFCGDLDNVIQTIYADNAMSVRGGGTEVIEAMNEQMDYAQELLKNYKRLDMMTNRGYYNPSKTLVPERIEKIKSWAETDEFKKLYTCMHDSENAEEFPFPFEKSFVEGNDFETIRDKLNKYWFDNISVSEVTHWNSKKDGKIKSITVDGRTDFVQGEWFRRGVPVELTVYRKG